MPTPVQTTPVKRPRGRPRKYPRPDDPVKLDQNTSLLSPTHCEICEAKLPKKIGRPPTSVLTLDLREEIISRLMNGELLSNICEEVDGVSRGKVERWRKADASFDEEVQVAREVGADAIAEGLLRMIDTKPATMGSGVNQRLDPGAVQWQRNRVEIRMRLLAMWFPKKYSQRAGSVGDGSITVSVVTGVPVVGVSGAVSEVTLDGDALRADRETSGDVAAVAVADGFSYDV